MANWDLAITDEQVPHPVFGADSGDFRAVPDPDTLVAVPHRPGVAQAFAVADRRCRAAMGRAIRGPCWPTQVERLTRLGIAVRVAFEAEFVIVARVRPRRPCATTRAGCSRSRGSTPAGRSAARILDDLDATGIAVHQFAKEYGPGQFEVSLLPAEPLVAVDRFLLARQLIRAAARDMGATASFMPKPFDDLPGNGLHVHLGLSRADDPAVDLIADADDPERGLAVDRGPPIAGLLAHAAGQTALASPTPNSSKRLLPGSWAPAHVCWAIGNRSALVRVPGRGAGRHLEVRGGDASMNPYLHLTGLLASIADGVERDLPLPAEARVDVGHLADDEAAAAGFPRLPADLAAAVDALRGRRGAARRGRARDRAALPRCEAVRMGSLPRALGTHGRVDGACPTGSGGPTSNVCSAAVRRRRSA